MDIRGTPGATSQTVEWDVVEGATGYRLTCELDDSATVSAVLPLLCRWWLVEALGAGITEAGTLWAPPTDPPAIPLPGEVSFAIAFGATTSGSGQSAATVTGAASLTTTLSIATSGTSTPEGEVSYIHDYTAARSQTTAPNYGWDWGVQYGGGGNTLQIVSNGIASGVPSAKLTIAADSGSDAIEGLKKWPVVLGQHDFFGVNYKFPSNWVEPSAAGWGAAIAQLGYQGLVNHTWGLFAHSNHVQWISLSGHQTWPGAVGDPNTSPIREFDNSTELGPWPNGPRAISTARFALNVWHQLIIEIIWSTCSTASADYDTVGFAGLTRIWHRQMGGAGALGTWTLMAEETDIPTLQWGYGYDFNGDGVAPFWSVTANDGTANAAHKFGIYSGGAGFARSIEHGKIVIGNTYDIVEAAMPDG